jgi:hypothetical protein
LCVRHDVKYPDQRLAPDKRKWSSGGYAKIPTLCKPRIPLRAGPVVMPSHTLGRHVHPPVAMGYHSLGSAWPTVCRSGRRIASALQSRGDNRGILGGTGEIPPGALARRTLSGSPRTVADSCRPYVHLPSRKVCYELCHAITKTDHA